MGTSQAYCILALHARHMYGGFVVCSQEEAVRRRRFSLKRVAGGFKTRVGMTEGVCSQGRRGGIRR